jgi:hypothetical protein
MSNVQKLKVHSLYLMSNVHKLKVLAYWVPGPKIPKPYQGLTDPQGPLASDLIQQKKKTYIWNCSCIPLFHFYTKFNNITLSTLM